MISATAPASNAWHLVAYTYDGSTNSLYIDGALEASNGNSPNSGTPTVFRIGSFSSAWPSPYWPGKVDEVRVSNVARAAGWIGTEYNNQASPSAFYSVGSAQNVGATGTPMFSPAAGTYTSTQTVTIGTSTSRAAIRYTTDGSTPSETAGTLYTGGITVSSTVTLKAIAYESGYTDSSVASGTYTIQPVVATPTFSPAAGTYSTTQTVTISTATSGASIRYTTDGSTPTETAGTLYTGAITVSSTTTVKALAYKSGYSDSSVASATYTILPVAATPTFNPSAGTYGTTQTVTISTTTSGALMRYTTDGSTPTETAGTLYTGAITVSSTATLNAIAYESGYTDSSVASATYTILPVTATPTFSPGAGTYSTTQTVTISTMTSGVSIRYTTDGSTPTETAGTLFTGAITVNSTTTLKAIAYESGYTDSSVASATYTIQPPPSITGLSPTSGAAGVQVTISGSGFGSTQGTGKVWLGTTLGTVVSWSDTAIAATVSSNATSGIAQVQQYGVWSNSVSFNVSTATITNVTPASGLPGAQVTIAGSGFGSAQGSGQVWLGTANAVVQSWSDSQVVAVIGTGCCFRQRPGSSGRSHEQRGFLQRESASFNGCQPDLRRCGNDRDHYRHRLRIVAGQRHGLAGEPSCHGGQLERYPGGGCGGLWGADRHRSRSTE